MARAMAVGSNEDISGNRDGGGYRHQSTNRAKNVGSGNDDSI